MIRLAKGVKSGKCADSRPQLDCQYEPECLQDFWAAGLYAVFARKMELVAEVKRIVMREHVRKRRFGFRSNTTEGDCL